jgi:DTW domain-containing protein YfiP
VTFAGHDRRPRLKHSEREGGKEVCTLDAATMAFRGADDASELENVNCFFSPFDSPFLSVRSCDLFGFQSFVFEDRYNDLLS